MNPSWMFVIGAGLATGNGYHLWPNVMPWPAAFWLGWGCCLLCRAIDLRKSTP